MTIDRDDILRLAHELNELAMSAHALFETLEAQREEITQYVQERLAESLACAECDIDSPPSLAVAIQQGWTRLQADDALGHNFLGLCAFCSSEAAKPAHEPEVVSQMPSRPKKGPRTSLFPTEE